MASPDLDEGKGPLNEGGGPKFRVLRITGGGTMLLVSQNVPCVVSDQMIFHTGISVVVMGDMETVITVVSEEL